MTHEELVEQVAEGMALGFGYDWNLLSDREWTRGSPATVFKEFYRKQARAAIKITGEACCDMRLTDYPAVQTSKIKSLTQGEKK